MPIRDEFDRRILEINLHFELLKCFEMDKPKITAYDTDADKIIEVQIDTQRINIYRANSYLLLYNLIESTIYNSIVTIFDSIKDNNLKYFDMITEVQKYWLNNLYKHDDKKRKETIIDTIMNVANQIFNNTIELASNEINYGGSLDARTIFDTAKSMKIDIGNVKRIYDERIHGEVLTQIKKNRNWLAHGEKTFSEVGANAPFKNLEESKKRVVDFLEEFIKSVEDYITNEQFKSNKVASQEVCKLKKLF